MTNLPVSDEKHVYDNILGVMGNTPLVKLGRVAQHVAPPIYAKLENLNPGGSIKDRVGLYIVEQAEKRGELKPGGTVVEATSGNTGVGLAIAAALKGYKTIFVMPDKMSNEKILLLRAYGAKVVITPTAVGPEDPRSYYEVAKRFAHETPNAILANQYHNPDNPKTHELHTAPEIWDQTDGKVTDVVIGHQLHARFDRILGSDCDHPRAHQVAYRRCLRSAAHQDHLAGPAGLLMLQRLHGQGQQRVSMKDLLRGTGCSRCNPRFC